MFFRQVFEPKLAQYAYLIGCQRTGEAIVVDPQRDVDRYIELAAAEGLRIVAATETHIHADFLSGVRELSERLGATAYLSAEGSPDWSYRWVAAASHPVRLLRDGDVLSVGNIELAVLHTPGHTPEHLSFRLTDRGSGADAPMGLLTGDFVFVADLGRPDLLESAAGEVGAMEPSAKALFHSVQAFLEQPDYLQVWPGHGAGSACGKALGAVPASTVGYERRFNAAIAAAHGGEDAFVAQMLDGQPEPPLYFARMKRENRDGPTVLGEMPRPSELDGGSLASLAGRRDVAVVDTRKDRRAFMAGHLDGALYAPFDRSFPTVMGSYVESGMPIYLIIGVDQVQDAVCDLVRIGLDDVVGFATPETLAKVSQERPLRATERVNFAGMRAHSGTSDAVVLDVRRKTEFDAGHLPAARNIAHTRLRARVDELGSAAAAVFVHCLSGARAAVASAWLERLDWDVVYVDDHIREAGPLVR